MIKIVQVGDPVLSSPAKEVTADLFGSDKLKKIIEQMSNGLSEQEDGVAIAAPQIGVPLRIFLITGKIFSKKDEEAKPDLVFINPKITNISKTKIQMEEGCLSVRWKFGLVKRSNKASVEACDFNGKKFTRSGSGLMAQIFQHEIDHLDGTLFIEKATGIKEYKPEPKK